MRAAFVGELVGTFLMVLIGTGCVAVAVLTDALQGLWQVASVWGVGVALAIYCTGGLSGAHLNPAVSLAFAVLRPGALPWRRLPLYWAAQLSGAVAAGGVVLAAFGPLLQRFEARERLVRGAPGSERAAMIFSDYFPNPAMFGTGPEAHMLVSPVSAMLVEAFGTGVLMFVILALTDRSNGAAPTRSWVPALIGLTVSVLIVLFAPLTQAGWNPARDLGPRLVAALAGFGEVALPGPRAGFWVYLAGPLLGAPVGGLMYDRLLRPWLSEVATLPTIAAKPGPAVVTERGNGHAVEPPPGHGSTVQAD